MKNSHDDPIEDLLREHFEGPVPEDGFSAKVVRELSPRRRFQVWPAIVGMLVGVLACGVCLLRAPLLRLGWHDWVSGNLSAPAVVLTVIVAGISLMDMAWMMAEADDPLETLS